MIPYNTDLEKLVLPEYGRLVHQMVNACKEIEDREMRNHLASAIVDTMKTMTMEKGKFSDDRKYWDHLYLISGGVLDVDYPYGPPEPSAINASPSKLPYDMSDFQGKHFGRILHKLVHEVALMPNSADKDACVELLANHIKKLLTINNTENADDRKVYSDLETLSNGSISLGEGIFDLPEYKEEKPAKSQKKKKNR